MRYGLVTTLVCFFSALLNPILAQQQLFKNYTVNDGLVSNAVRRIFQDSKGFIWIATWEGVSKYDGHVFTSYNTSNGLSHNMANDFYESVDGRLYIALNNGSIDVITDNQISHKSAPATTIVNRFAKGAGQRVIVSTDREGLQEFRNGKLSQPKQRYPADSYISLEWLNDSVMIAASDNAIAAFNANFELIAELRFSNQSFTEATLFQDSKKRIWVGMHSGLHLLSHIPQKNTSVTFADLPVPFNIPELGKRINAIYEDAEGVIWFGTTGGLVRVNPDGTYRLITVSTGLASNIVTCIFQDKEKNIWFGTAVGLSKLVTKSGIELFPLENGVRANDNLYLLYPFKKNFFLVSTLSGVQVFNKQNGHFDPAINGHSYFFYVVSNSLPPLFIATNTYATFDTVACRFHEDIPLPLKPGGRVIKDKNGNYFGSKYLQLFFFTGKKYQQILDYRISGLLIDKHGDLWVGTWQNGLFRFRYQYRNDSLLITEKDHFLQDENIRSLFEDTKGNIWAGTRYHGVQQLTRNEKGKFSISNFDQHKGLSYNYVKVVREDKNGNIWLAFDQGLDKLVLRDSTYRIFNFSRVNNYFTSVVGMEMDADQSIWLATGEGLTHIKDGELEKTPPLPVYITKVFSTDSVYPLHAGKIQLNYQQNQLQFEFASPGFINEKQLMYSYRLTGSSNEQWTKGSNQHIVSYASLRPGNYTFEVRSLGWNEEWGKPAAFEFVINSPFWQTWWFISLCLSGFLLIVYGVIKKRIKRIQHEAAMKQRIAETEMMALRAQMNPHFIFNCLNSIDNLIQMNEKEKATSYLSKFAKLIRSILENSKNNVVPCWKDMETLQLYLELEALRFDNKFLYRIDIADEIMQGDYKVPPLVIQPFVENAIHHGLLNKIDRDKKLSIQISLVKNQIRYVVEDNGVGRQKAGAYKELNKPAYGSMGMQITADRINLFNQHNNSAVKITDLYDDANVAIGTKVEVTLTIQP